MNWLIKLLGGYTLLEQSKLLSEAREERVKLLEAQAAQFSTREQEESAARNSFAKSLSEIEQERMQAEIKMARAIDDKGKALQERDGQIDLVRSLNKHLGTVTAARDEALAQLKLSAQHVSDWKTRCSSLEAEKDKADSALELKKLRSLVDSISSARDTAIQDRRNAQEAAEEAAAQTRFAVASRDDLGRELVSLQDKYRKLEAEYVDVQVELKSLRPWRIEGSAHVEATPAASPVPAKRSHKKKAPAV